MKFNGMLLSVKVLFSKLDNEIFGGEGVGDGEGEGVGCGTGED